MLGNIEEIKQGKILDQLLLSSKIGDGHYEKYATSSMFQAVAKQIDYISFKRNHLLDLDIHCNDLKKLYSGYKKGAFSYQFYTRCHPLLDRIQKLSITECVESLNKYGLVMYYLDDGSLHQSRRYGNLYCNMFNDEEVEVLINKIYELYPIGISKKRIDRKKDGRAYNYVSIPRNTMEVFLEDVEEFILRYRIYSMLYKVGIKYSPSTTIESLKQ